MQAQSEHLRASCKDRIIGTWKAANVEAIARRRSVGNEFISSLYCGESSGTSDEAPVMGVEQQPQVIFRIKATGTLFVASSMTTAFCRRKSCSERRMVPMTKQKKLRHLEYYDLQDTFDRLYQRSQSGAVFRGSGIQP